MNSRLRKFIAGTTTVLIGAHMLHAQVESVSTPVGYVNFALNEGSDTILGLPLKREAVHSGVAQVMSEEGGSSLVKIGGLDSEMLQDGVTYYLRITSGELAGEYYWVAEAGNDGILLNNEGLSVSAMADCWVEVVPAWTLDSLFDPQRMSDAGFPLVVSAGRLPFQRGSQIFVYENALEGINHSPSYSFFLTAEGWLQQASAFPAAGDFVLQPDAVMIVRQPAQASGRSLKLAGMAETGHLASLVSSRAAGMQDNVLSLARGSDLRLDELDFDLFEDSAGVLPFQRKDVLYVWEQNGTGINRAPQHTFFRVGGVWRRQDSGFSVADGFVLKAGTPFIIRKAASADAVQMWVNKGQE